MVGKAEIVVGGVDSVLARAELEEAAQATDNARAGGHFVVPVVHERVEGADHIALNYVHYNL